MPGWAAMGSFYSFIANNLTARGQNYRIEMQSVRYFNIKSLPNALKTITLFCQNNTQQYDVYSKAPPNQL
jgi:hypothetical protein